MPAPLHPYLTPHHTPPRPLIQALAKRAHMGFPEPPASAQELAWSRVLELFGRTLKA